MYVFLIILLVIIIYMIFLPLSREGFSQVGRVENQEETIFVSVPSYRDVDCKQTLRELYNKANHPETIYVGVFEQNDGQCPEERCDAPSAYQHQVRYHKIDYREAKGPFYARAVINNHLYQGEKYYLMIDAHTLFLENWDVRMKDQLDYLRQQGVKKPIISSYPHHQDFSKSNEITEEKRNTTTLICDIINAKRYPTEAQALEKPSGRFYKSLLLGAGFLFTYGTFFRDIELDETLQHIFSGEEIWIAILAYTHGWDIYAPAYMNVFHYYNHKKPSWYTDVLHKKDEERDKETKSYQQLIELVDRDENHPKMGKDRSVGDFWKTLGFNRSGATLKDKFPTQSKSQCCDRTRQIDYPITEHFC